MKDQFREMFPWAGGSAAVTNQLWIGAFADVWQGLIAVGGSVVLALTIYSKILDVRLKKRELRGGK